MNIIEILLHTKAVLWEKERYEIFPRTYSPLKIELSRLLNMPRYFDMLTDLLSLKIREIAPDKVLGAFTSGIPLATAISLKTNLPMAFVRRSAKEYGEKNIIEGIIEKDEEVVLVDDIFSTLKNNKDYINNIRKYTDNISLLVVFDYQLCSHLKLKEEGIELYTLLNFKDLVTKLEKWKLISKDKKEKMIKEVKFSRKHC